MQASLFRKTLLPKNTAPAYYDGLTKVRFSRAARA